MPDRPIRVSKSRIITVIMRIAPLSSASGVNKVVRFVCLGFSLLMVQDSPLKRMTLVLNAFDPGEIQVPDLSVIIPGDGNIHGQGAVIIVCHSPG